jgi:hypothetical protein
MSQEQRIAIQKALAAAVMAPRQSRKNADDVLSLDAFPFANTKLSWVNGPHI